MVYEIQRYDLRLKTIYTYKERPDVQVVEGQNGERDRFVDQDGGDADISQVTTLVSSLDKVKENMGRLDLLLNRADYPEFLPYVADVTEDLPAGALRIGVEPKTYKGCQLMTDTHGGYLQFKEFNTDEQKVLRIAMNSHYYSHGFIKQ